MRKPLLFTAALSMAGLSAGCVVAVGNRGYSDRDVAAARAVQPTRFDALLAESRDLSLGMSRHEALAGFPADLTTLVAARRENGRSLEVYQIAAYEKRSGAEFARWLYFIDNELVEVSPRSVKWETDPERQRNWFGRELPAAPAAEAPAAGV